MLTVWTRFTRARLSPSALSNLATGLLIGGGWPLQNVGAATLVAASGMVWLLYLFGMGLNDFADRDRDRTLHPERPLPSGRLSESEARAALWILLIGATALAILGGFKTSATGLTLVVWIVAYNYLAKEHALWGPLAMAAVRGTLVLGGTWIAIESNSPLDIPPAAAAATVLLFTYIALVTWFSQAEEASPKLLLRRGRVIAFTVAIGLACIGLGFSAKLAGSEKWMALFIGISVVAYVSVRSLAPLRQSPPQPFPATWRLLLGIFWLDAFSMAIHVAFAWCLVPFGLLALTMRPPRRT